MSADRSRKEIRTRLINGPLDESGQLFEELRGMGFDFDGTWVVNPYWSVCGRFQVDPIEEYGSKFLESPLASYLGFSASERLVLSGLVHAPLVGIELS